MSGWSVYIVRCADGTLYTGIALDVDRRLAEHNGSNRLGSRYVRARRPVVLVYAEPAASRSAAAVREHAIKRMTRAEKLALMRARRGSSTKRGARVVRESGTDPKPHA